MSLMRTTLRPSTSTIVVGRRLDRRRFAQHEFAAGVEIDDAVDRRETLPVLTLDDERVDLRKRVVRPLDDEIGDAAQRAARAVAFEHGSTPDQVGEEAVVESHRALLRRRRARRR
jgi:hypothetical protein